VKQPIIRQKQNTTLLQYPLSGSSFSTELLSSPRCMTSTVCRKHPWSYLEKMELMYCYYKARAAGRGCQKRLKKIWDDKTPDKLFNSTNNLACHVNSKLLSEHELQDIQQRAIGTTQMCQILWIAILFLKCSLGIQCWRKDSPLVLPQSLK